MTPAPTTPTSSELPRNEELAKSRAVAIRNALTAAGVPEASIEMRPPLFVETGVSTASAESRRVEINRM